MIGIEPVAVAHVAPFWGALGFVVSTVAIVATAVLFLGEEAPRRRDWARRHPAKSAIMMLVCVFATLYGGSKSSWRWDTETLSPGSATATNDTVSISWTLRDGVLPTDNVHVDYRPNNSTNDADWATLGIVSAGSLSYTGSLVGTTNYDYYIWTDHVVIPVVTNGVYHLRAVMPSTNRVITPAVEIRGNGAMIAPPKEDK